MQRILTILGAGQGLSAGQTVDGWLFGDIGPRRGKRSPIHWLDD
jgi:hypothetical protein